MAWHDAVQLSAVRAACCCACGDSEAADAIEQTTTANSGLTYDALTAIYTYVWKTDKAWRGKCATLNVRLGDGSDRTAEFQFK